MVRHKRQRPKCHMYCPLVAKNVLHGGVHTLWATKIQNCPGKKREGGRGAAVAMFVLGGGFKRGQHAELIFDSRIFRLLKE